MSNYSRVSLVVSGSFELIFAILLLYLVIVNNPSNDLFVFSSTQADLAIILYDKPYYYLEVCSFYLWDLSINYRYRSPSLP